MLGHDGKGLWQPGDILDGGARLDRLLERVGGLVERPENLGFGYFGGHVGSRLGGPLGVLGVGSWLRSGAKRDANRTVHSVFRQTRDSKVRVESKGDDNIYSLPRRSRASGLLGPALLLPTPRVRARLAGKSTWAGQSAPSAPSPSRGCLQVRQYLRSNMRRKRMLRLPCRPAPAYSLTRTVQWWRRPRCRCAVEYAEHPIQNMRFSGAARLEAASFYSV